MEIFGYALDEINSVELYETNDALARLGEIKFVLVLRQYHPKFQFDDVLVAVRVATILLPRRDRRRGVTNSGGRQRLDSCRQAGNLARDGVVVDHALAGSALHLRLCRLQRWRRRCLVRAGDRRLDLFHEGPHARLARLIAIGANDVLADALARGGGVGHGLFSINRMADRGRSDPSTPGREVFYASRGSESRNPVTMAVSPA